MKKFIKPLVIMGTILVLSTSFVITKNYNKSEVFTEENEKTEKKKTYSNGIAMILETGLNTGIYEMATSDSWPTEGYFFNSELSKCENGGEVSWNNTNKKVLMSGNTSDKCYVYFDVYVAPVINDVTIVSLGNDSNNYKMEISVTKGTEDIKTYYYSIDNGTTYITSNNNSYTFTLHSSGTYNCYFYVEDINGVKSNIFNKSFHTGVLAPSKEVTHESGTVTTVDGEVVEVYDPDSLKSYLTLSNSSLEPETIDGYSNLAIFDVNFNNIIDIDAIYCVPGVASGNTIIVKQYVLDKWNNIDVTVVGDIHIKFKLTQSGTVAIYKKIS